MRVGRIIFTAWDSPDYFKPITAVGFAKLSPV